MTPALAVLSRGAKAFNNPITLDLSRLSKLFCCTFSSFYLPPVAWAVATSRRQTPLFLLGNQQKFHTPESKNACRDSTSVNTRTVTFYLVDIDEPFNILVEAYASYAYLAARQNIFVY
jgi:hypothetical protein